MGADILTAMRDGMGGFSKGQKRSAAYILESYDKAAFLTASKLGQAAQVSESTVVRFAMELGYEGYPEMQKALQEILRTRLTSVQRVEAANTQFADQDVVSMVIQSDIRTLQRTAEILDREALDAAVDAIVSAKKVYIVGARSSSTIASFLNFYLRIMLDRVQLVASTASSEMLEQLMHSGEGDVVIGISLPRYSRRTVSAMQYVKSGGGRLVAITDSLQAPIARIADHILLAKSEMVSFVDSLVAPLSVVNALVVAISRKLGKELSESLTDLEKLWADYDIYENIDV
ncbi:MAG: MurR/RpiR family transcriptional regulator [Oscillospiraceae bacterium]|nr:MurR/RpiR family transcriptional regulator [Oscillospiraceae bacterium]